jgi:hypothetical protein
MVDVPHMLLQAPQETVSDKRCEVYHRLQN